MARLMRRRRRCSHARNICVITNQKSSLCVKCTQHTAHTQLTLRPPHASKYTRTAAGARITHKLRTTHRVRQTNRTDTLCAERRTYYALDTQTPASQPRSARLEDMSECSRGACARVCVLCFVCGWPVANARLRLVCLVLGDSAHAAASLLRTE